MDDYSRDGPTTFASYAYELNRAHYQSAPVDDEELAPWVASALKALPASAESKSTSAKGSENGEKVAKLILEALGRPDAANEGVKSHKASGKAPGGANFGVKGGDDGMKGGYSKLGADKGGPSSSGAFDGVDSGIDPKLMAVPWNINEYHGDTVLPFNAQEGWDDENMGKGVDERMIPPIHKKVIRIRWIGLFVCILFFLTFPAYILLRAMYTLDLGAATWYGAMVLSFEVIGGMALFPYALTLVLKVQNDAPPTEMDLKLLPETVLRYHVRVLIPCYKEPVDVVSKTVLASLHAPVPVGCQKTVYLCDDGKDVEKKKFVHSLNRENVVYVSGRQRRKGEMNGKSCNVNNVCRLLYPAGVEVPLSEVLAIFDADQVANPDFYIKMTPMMDGGADVGMVLSPQTFYNLNPDGDIFNHGNTHFWHYIQTGYDAWGIISCTGTNFLMRAKPFMQCGGFPEDTLTEDFALGIEFKRFNWQCRYVEEYLAVGEAPEAVRNAFQQRSRWSKGHFQLFFSSKCPMFRSKLPLVARFFYGAVVIAYFSDFMVTPMLTLVPLVTIWIGTFPIIINWYAAVCITIYFAASTLVAYTVYNLAHIKSLWFAQVANAILWFAFLKAFLRTTLGKLVSGNIVFKSTIKGLQKMADSPMRDIWIASITVVTIIVSLVFGFIHLTTGPLRSPLIISLLWCFYNLVPQTLLLWYTVVPLRGYWRRFFNYGCKFGMLVMFVTSFAAVILIWPMLPPEYDTSTDLTNSLTFYQTQWIGQLPEDYPIAWRGDSFLQDYQSGACSTGYIYNVTRFPRQLMKNKTMGYWQMANCSLPIDMLGGYITNAGLGNIKMTLPMAYSMSMLSWSLITNQKEYRDAEASEKVKSIIRWGAEWLMKTYNNQTEEYNVTYLVTRVGNLSYEKDYWGRPERSNYRRTAYAILIEEGFSDLGGQVAAGLASSSLALGDSDPKFANDLLEMAKDVFHAANLTKARWTNYDVEAQYYYNSSSFWDDLAWGAAWLYRATKDPDYLKNYYYAGIMHLRRELITDIEYIFDVDRMFWGTQVLMSQISGLKDPTYMNQTSAMLTQWVCPGKKALYTTYGRAYHPNETGLHITMNIVYLSTMYAGLLETAGEPEKAMVYQCWVLSQVRYVLGDSGKSFVVGVGEKPPTRTQDRAAACPDPPAPCNVITSLLSSKHDSHELTGALIRGPWKTDEYENIRSDDSAMVGLEYNVGLTGALAGVFNYKEGLWQICLQTYGVFRYNPVCGYSSILH